MAIRHDQFLTKLSRRLADTALLYAKPKIPSRTLRRAVNVFVLSPTYSRIQIPHYWAVYVHDGRGPFGPVRSQMLVWFRNPRDDPRLRAGITPVRASKIKRLTRSQFVHWLEQNAIARAAGKPEPMIVTRFVKTPTQAKRFFANEPGGGMHGFKDEANRVGTPMVREHFLKALGPVLNLKGSVTVRI